MRGGANAAVMDGLGAAKAAPARRGTDAPKFAPRTYRLTLAKRWEDPSALHAALFLGLFYWLGGRPPWFALLLGLMVAAAVVTEVIASRRTVVLTPEYLEAGGLFERRRFMRSDVQSYSRNYSTGVLKLTLYCSEPDTRTLVVQLPGLDAALAAWLGGLKERDGEEAAAAMARSLADHRFGETPEARYRHLALWHGRVALFLPVHALWAWCLHMPIATEWVAGLAALCPVLAITLAYASQGAVCFAPEAGSLRTPVWSLALLGVMAPLYTLNGFRLMDALPALPWIAALGVAYLALALGVDPLLRRFGRGLWVAVLAAVWAAGVFAGVNAVFDGRITMQYPTIVTARRLPHSLAEGNLEVRAPAGFPMFESIRVSDRRFGAVQVGDTVCVTTHPGFLGIAWYGVEPCRHGPARG
jgi:hypothetical protein